MTIGTGGSTRSGDDAPAPEARARPSLVGSCVAELLGTFMLLFFGVGSVLAVGGAADASQKLAIGLAFGLAILAAAYTLGHVSGAHLNPAVTLGLLVSGRFSARAAPFYIAAQLVGAVLGVLAVAAVSPGDVAASVTQPGAGVSQGAALLAEAVLGFVLVLVVKGTAIDSRAEGPAAGMAIGLTIVAGHLAMIPISGASFNPARSFGSALVAGDFHAFWLYVAGPVVGGMAAGLVHEHVLARSEPAG